jgi:hypothetical protein
MSVRTTAGEREYFCTEDASIVAQPTQIPGDAIGRARRGNAAKSIEFGALIGLRRGRGRALNVVSRSVPATPRRPTRIPPRSVTQIRPLRCVSARRLRLLLALIGALLVGCLFGKSKRGGGVFCLRNSRPARVLDLEGPFASPPGPCLPKQCRRVNREI